MYVYKVDLKRVRAKC